jgi:predicted nuclease of predicted toxin-antitoxin system
MKFIVDQQLPPALAGWLRRKGHDASHVREHGFREAEGDAIWPYAEANGAIIGAKDSDFSTRRTRLLSGPTIPWRRVGNTTTPELFAILDYAWATVELDISTETVVEVR